MCLLCLGCQTHKAGGGSMPCKAPEASPYGCNSPGNMSYLKCYCAQQLHHMGFGLTAELLSPGFDGLI